MSDRNNERAHVEHAFHVGERREERKKLTRRIRNTVAAVGVAAALSQTPIPGAAADYLSNIGVDQNRPTATEANMGGTTTITLDEVHLENGHTVIWPILRKNPAIHDGKDGLSPNVVNWTDVETINHTPIDAKSGTEITIANPTFVMGENTEGSLSQKGLWEVLDIVKKDGTEELDYVSVSGNTGGFVDFEPKGIMTPISQANTTLEDKLDITTVTP